MYLSIKIIVHFVHVNVTYLYYVIFKLQNIKYIMSSYNDIEVHGSVTNIPCGLAFRLPATLKRMLTVFMKKR